METGKLTRNFSHLNLLNLKLEHNDIEVEENDDSFLQSKQRNQNSIKKQFQSTFCKGSRTNRKKIQIDEQETKNEFDQDINEDNIKIEKQSNQKTYNQIIMQHIDLHVQYEDSVLNIFNIKNKESITYPFEFKEFAYRYRKNEKFASKSRTLFLDIENTLLETQIRSSLNHSSEDDIICLGNNSEYTENNQKCPKELQLIIKYRPHLFEFISEVSKYFEIILFNDNVQEYTIKLYESIKQFLKKQDQSNELELNLFSYILGNQVTCSNQSGQIIKYLDLFTYENSNRRLEDSIIVDNNIFCFQKNVTNGIFIPCFNGNKKDHYLLYLKNYLINRFILQNSDTDVRQLIKEDFKLDEICTHTNTAIIKERMHRQETI